MATKSLRPAAGDWQIARQPERGPFFQLHRDAALKNGVLAITLPKPFEAQQRERRIAVKGETAGSRPAPSPAPSAARTAPQPQTKPAGGSTGT